MDTSLEALRTAALSNNANWLKSFGCEVDRDDNVIYIRHRELLDYNACLILSTSQNACDRLQRLLTEIDRMSITPTIYLDDDLISPPLDSVLAIRGFKAVNISLTVAGLLTPISPAQNFILQPAGSNDFDLWVSLYSEGFDRYGKDAEIDRSRWRQAFTNHEGITNWFFVKGNTRIGICQTCLGSKVTGVFSFTLKPSERSFRNLRGSIRALWVKLTEKGEDYIYFDLLEKESSINRRPIVQFPRGFLIIRRMIGYSLSN